MSAIFGIINFNEQPVDPSDLKKMQSAMSYWGPDGQYLWNEGCAGLGQLQLYNTPESVNEKFPLINSARELAFVSTTRIDNREELFHLLDINNEIKSALTDAELMFVAFCKWGKECVHRFLGDWSFAVMDKNKNELFLARDHFGSTGVYYCMENNQFIFSSSLKGILAIRNSTRPNLLRLAEFTAGSIGDAFSTCYENIFRLPPSHYLIVNKNSIRSKYYWNVEEIEPISKRSFSDAKEEYIDILNKSVECRLRSTGKIGSMLSGGLDSGTVSTIAAQQLAKKGQKLTTFTSVPISSENFLKQDLHVADENYLAGLTALASGNIEHILVDSANLSPFEAIKKYINIHDEPIRNMSNAYWLLAIYEKAKEIGVKTILSAGIGNATLSYPPLRYLDYYDLNNKKISLSDFFRISGIRNRIIKPFVPQRILQHYRLIRSTRSQVRTSYIKSETAKKHSLFDNILMLNKKFWGYSPITYGFLNILKPGWNYYGSLHQQNGAAYGIGICDPTTDKRLIEFSAGLIKASEKGVLVFPREFLVSAMKNIIPSEVLHNKSRGVQSADLFFRTKLNISELQDFALKIKTQNEHFIMLSENKYNKIIEDLNKDEKPDSRVKLICFYRSLAVELFLNSRFSI
jgi:asparagine synthase (glutamine-hydrolysing)